jgi:demethylmenaquinone methyltransferase/2-methoxy-6-polyprenyl-1,4-benzoquinol methylase
MDCEKINPYSSDSRSKSEQIKTMFDNIAPAYDFMNRAMTFGIDRCWRRKAVDMLAKTSPREILDVATGTGDLAMLLARRIKESKVTGLDLSEGMIAVGRKKELPQDIAFLNVTDFDERYTVYAYYKKAVCYGSVRRFLDFLKNHSL